LGKILGRDSGVRKDLLIFEYKEARKAGIIKRWKNGMVEYWNNGIRKPGLLGWDQPLTRDSSAISF